MPRLDYKNIFRLFNAFLQVSREDVAKVMLKQLEKAVCRTIFNLDTCTKCVSLSFSGGVDSLLIAHLMAHCLPQNVPLDLVNVAFAKEKVLNISFFFFVGLLLFF